MATHPMDTGATGFQTQRLCVVHWSGPLAGPGSAALLAEIGGLLTPEVVRDLPPAFTVQKAPGAMAAWVAARDAESEVYLVKARTDGALIGLLILARGPEAAGPDAPQVADWHIGYLFAQAVWGQGLAGELVAGLVSWIAPRGPQRLLGGVAHGNPASARVLQRQGFVRQPDLSSHEVDVFAKSIGAP